MFRSQFKKSTRHIGIIFIFAIKSPWKIPIIKFNMCEPFLAFTFMADAILIHFFDIKKVIILYVVCFFLIKDTRKWIVKMLQFFFFQLNMFTLFVADD